MMISIKANRAQDGNRGVTRAKEMTEDFILELLHDSGSRGRLLFDLADTCVDNWTNGRLRSQKSGAVRQRSHSIGFLVWMQLVELPSTQRHGTPVHHGKFLLYPELQDRIQYDDNGNETSCSVEVFGDNVGVRLKLCDPYALICGKKLADVEDATAIVVNALQRHQTRCDCSPRF